MAQSAQQDQLLGSSPPDIVLSPSEPGDVREAANPAPQLAAIRGEGIPPNCYDDEKTPRQTGRDRRESDASQISGITSRTLSDRGDALYRDEYPLESPLSTNGEMAIPANESPKPLVNRLLELRTPSGQCNGAFFYPRAELEALITPKEVAQVIAQGRRSLEIVKKTLTDDEIDEYAARACLDTLHDGTKVSYKKVFATLLFIRQGWDIVLFIDEHLHDGELPLEAVTVTGTLRMRHKSDPEADLPCLSHWDPLAHHYFEQNQWSLLAPFLAKGDNCAWFYQLSGKDVLPWTSKDSCVREGGYGSISRVKIHPNHHNFEGGNSVFAVKEFKPVKTPPTPGANLSKDFEREIEILMVCQDPCCIHYPHLVVSGITCGS
jgi:hypothetical protein